MQFDVIHRKVSIDMSISISYDGSRAALFHPAGRPTVFGRDIPDAGRIAAVCAESSRLAYLRFEDPGDSSLKILLGDALAKVGISSLACFSDDSSSTEAFAAVLPKSAGTLIAFRGTEPDEAADIAIDLGAVLEPWGQGGRVHAGFAHSFSRIRAQIERWMSGHPVGDGALVVTGHSLGAALATLAAAAWRADRLVTFGSPRVGDQDFVALLPSVAIERYVNCCDIVTRVPPKLPGLFVDTAPAFYISSAGRIVGTSWSEQQIDTDRSSARERYLLEQAWVRGNVVVRDLADHAPINYVRAFI